MDPHVGSRPVFSIPEIILHMLATGELITKHAYNFLYRYSKLRKAKLLRWV
jgi:hypothetical protein